MENIIDGQIIKQICSFLDPMDIANMCRVYPKLSNDLYYIFKDSVARKIDAFFRNYFRDNYGEFRKQMIKNKAVISGSFIIQSILGEIWNDSDIDIYIPIRNMPITTTDAGNPKTFLEDYLYEVLNYNMTHSIATSNYIIGPVSPIKTIREYVKADEKSNKRRKLDNTTIQTILIDINPNIKDILEFIHSNFDFDICKNIFYYTNYGYNVCIYKPNQIIDKHTDFKFSNLTFDHMRRYHKYIDRGFSFSKSEKEIEDMILKNM